MSRERKRGSPTTSQDETQPGTSESGSRGTLTGTQDLQTTSNDEERNVDQNNSNAANGERRDVPDAGESGRRVPQNVVAQPKAPPPSRERNRSRSPTKAKASMDLTHQQSKTMERRDIESKSKPSKRWIRVPQIFVKSDSHEAPRLVDTGVSTADSQRVPTAPSVVEPISELPYVEPVYILVQAERPTPPRLVDTAVGTDKGRAHSTPSVRRPKPSTQANDRVKSEEALVEESDIESTSTTTSREPEPYDLEDHEILITKTAKIFKKRPNKALPEDDSEESLYVRSTERMPPDNRISYASRRFEEMESDVPQSIDNIMVGQFTDLTDSSTSSFSKRKRKESLGLAAGTLHAGYVFVNLHGDTARRWLRLGRARPQLPGPADRRRDCVLHRHPAALHGQGIRGRQFEDCARGQHPDRVLFPGRRLLQRPDQQLRLPAGGHGRSSDLSHVHTGGKLQHGPDYVDHVLQRHWWTVLEHDMGQLAAHHRLLLRAVSGAGQRLLLLRRRSRHRGLLVPQQLAGPVDRLAERAPGARVRDHYHMCDCLRLHRGGAHAGGRVQQADGPDGFQLRGVLRQLLCAQLYARFRLETGHPDHPGAVRAGAEANAILSTHLALLHEDAEGGGRKGAPH
ncbi:uncharacterized protein Targ isoform X4 [Drosophila pseudoobscura]|uniref:Uncharacterized protein Targ isoform X4 n=1 Tax=Drosophila pseudoobscura pseudoobscura TaxID=46245 RepID=A0A6I8VRK4_DROPS|nr:uncharacterized protein LOC26534446 isoform X4 [Drosophila pseudoobscura]